MDSPETGIKLFFNRAGDYSGVYEYAARIPFFKDKHSYMVVKTAAFFDLFTFSTYSATALFFALISFIGGWMLFKAFYELKPTLHRWIAFAALFIPSVVFWGSGILKDTITLAFLGMSTLFIKRIFIKGRFSLLHSILLLLCFYMIYAIKIYILLAFLPAAMLWIYVANLSKIRSSIVIILMLPFVVGIAIVSGYYAISQVGKDDPRYALEKIGNTAKVTAYDIAYQTGRDAGSTYALGELDGSLGSLVRLAPQAINVSMFRPYLWEVRNPLMLMSAVEALIFFVLTLWVIAKARGAWLATLSNPHILFCLAFSLTFAFAVGVSTFNFGTLSRYKIPLLPFYSLALIFIYYENRERKFAELERTE